ncbi:MAG: carbohydrate ABC transporter permease [Rhizobiaceae bacterium]|nr:carbohydrate ABC transporter permease [Rhizobiaceae bacterium]
MSASDRLPLWLKSLNTAGLGIWLFVAMFPFLWMFLISFRLPVDAFSVPPQLFAPFTLRNFYGVWVTDGFWRYAVNTGVVTVFSVVISLAIACPAAYALSRYRGSLGFWLLVAALIFRAMPHVVLLTAYRPAFFSLGIWSRYETLIIVLTAINQPFTIWMMRSFFMNIPKELDEAALIDGCSRFQAFRLAIMPVMWPGVVTAALFAFLLSYNDFLISSQLMNGEMQTMTAALGNYMGQAKHLDKLMLGIAGAVSVTIPVIILIYLFQKQIVAGMTAGAVKG